ncbi:MAG: S-methyl-5'-thioadenosine phosphorylase [Chloroflexi bacterium]|nr:MAG: S-methyl-5'-thioadenosine phosphorylase [Chloroflexota bacterium]
MPKAEIGVIGGTGLYQMEELQEVEEVSVKTPFGDPSDVILIGRLGGRRVAFLARHGRGHRISPSELPSRANIFALKSLGVEWLISVNSAGSFREEIRPGDLVIPDQLIDRTKGRPSTFFEGELVAHISFAEPFCPVLSEVLYQAAEEAGARVHRGGTFLIIEGPAFSTRAESKLYRSWGADIIGMTALPEAKLAREAEICYASLAFATDYDSWLERLEPVNVETIISILAQNAEMARRIIRLAVERVPNKRECECARALKNAIVTAPEFIPERLRKDLSLLIGKYLPSEDQSDEGF